jgi:hypothetical protein
MPQDTPQSAEPATIRTRLQRLRELIELKADTPAGGPGNARPEPPSRLALRVVVDEAPDVAAERTVRGHYLGLDEIAETLGLSHEAADSVIAGLQQGVPYSDTTGEGERVYLIPAAAIPPPSPTR